VEVHPCHLDSVGVDLVALRQEDLYFSLDLPLELLLVVILEVDQERVPLVDHILEDLGDFVAQAILTQVREAMAIDL
jgi:hypothetical protein